MKKDRGEVSRRLTSFKLADRNDWFIKMSVVGKLNKTQKEDAVKPTILLVMMNKKTDETVVRFFSVEQDAIDYIEEHVDKKVMKPEAK